MHNQVRLRVRALRDQGYTRPHTGPGQPTSVHMPHSMVADLERLANRLGMLRSQLVKELLSAAIRDAEEELGNG